LSNSKKKDRDGAEHRREARQVGQHTEGARRRRQGAQQGPAGEHKVRRRRRGPRHSPRAHGALIHHQVRHHPGPPPMGDPGSDDGGEPGRGILQHPQVPPPEE